MLLEESLFITLGEPFQNISQSFKNVSWILVGREGNHFNAGQN